MTPKKPPPSPKSATADTNTTWTVNQLIIILNRFNHGICSWLTEHKAVNVRLKVHFYLLVRSYVNGISQTGNVRAARYSGRGSLYS